MATASTPAGAVPGPNGNVILVVENDEGLLRQERLALEEEGYSVACAGSGEEALEMLTSTCPSLILLDILLPLMDGFTTCQKIRETSQAPIIMVTYEGHDEDKVHVLEMGAADYITRPFSTNELTYRVKAVLRRINAAGTKDVGDPSRPSSPDMTFLDESVETVEPAETAVKSTTKATAEAVKIPDAGFMVSPGEAMDPATIEVPASIALPGDDENYEGAVKLVVETTGAIKNMADFVNALRENPGIHLLRMVSNSRRDGMDVWLRLREPNPLRTTLMAATGGSKVEAMGRSESEPETPVLKVLLD